MSRIVFVLCMTVVMFGPAVFAGVGEWERAQTYGMLPLDPEEAAVKGWTVNGLWTGYGMPEAVRGTTHLLSGPDEYPAEWTYPTTKAYVDACHEAGILVPGTLFGIGDHAALRKRFPQIEDCACRLANGATAYYEMGSRLFMCSNNATYDEVLIILGKEAIDAGADLIVFDEVQGNELSLYWPNATGFCDQCLAAYRDHLRAAYTPEELKARFDIEDVETVDFVARLAPQGGKDWADTDALFKECWTVQKRQNFERAKKVCAALRAHMKEVGNEIPICANTTEMGLEGSNGIRLSAVQWGQVVDFGAYERLSEELLPRSKWVASERLAGATFRLPSTVLIRYAPLHAMELEYLTGKSNRSVYFYGMLAEAYANRCGFVNYHQEKGLPKAEGLWADVFRAQRFIVDHRDLFDPRAETGAKAAILYIENEGQRYRTASYMGMAQALAESSIPFDVIIDGGDGFVPVTLTRDKLDDYELTILPHALHLAGEQKEAVESYVEAGGVAITADPATFGIEGEASESARGEGRFVVLPKTEAGEHGLCDLAAAYHYGYDDALRRRIAETVDAHSETILEVSPDDRTVCVYPHYQASRKRVLLHVVNSDYDGENNRMRQKDGITIRLKRPPFYGEAREATVYSPDFGEEASRKVGATLEDGFIDVRIPTLDVYQIVVL